MNIDHKRWLPVVALLALGSVAHAQAPTTPAAPTPTIWRFFGIPQGLQKIRDVSTNRRGNFPGLERKPPVKRIGDPANLESENPAIKEAAKIKQAEDLKMQKIKAIKYLAKMGCGCYDKEGKITDALIAAMDDCTPDVRMAAIEAIETTASGECCKSCGSTSCCNEKVTKRLSEIAYERDDNGCPVEASAEIREAAAKALCVCCPNRATGPIEEDIPELEEPATDTDPKPATATGEGGDESQSAEGEGGGDGSGTGEGDDAGDGQESGQEDGEEMGAESSGGVEQDSAVEGDQPIKKLKEADELTLRSVKADRVRVEVGKLKMVGGMAIKPVTFRAVPKWNPPTPAPEQTPSAVEFSLNSLPEPIRNPESVERPKTIASPKTAPQPKNVKAQQPKALPLKKVSSRKTAVARKKIGATVVGVDHRTGRVLLRSSQTLPRNASVTVYHSYLTGERLVGHLIVAESNGTQATAMVTDRAMLSHVEAGDRAVCF